METMETNENKDVCRTCMSRDGELIAMDSIICVNDKEEYVITMLETCTSLEIPQIDSFPQSVCHPCLEKLAAAYLFREMCIETNETLKTMEMRIKLEDSVTNTLHPALIVEEDDKLKSVVTEDEPELVSEEDSQLVFEEDKPEAVDSREKFNKQCDTGEHEVELNINEHIKEEMEEFFGQSEVGFGCDICGRRYKSKYSMHKHRKVHSGSPELYCEICAKQFTRHYDVKRHMTKHTGLKPYTCSLCSASFTQSGSLAVHMRTHQCTNISDSKKHLCPKCGKTFGTSSTLHRHMRSHTDGKISLPNSYLCSICGIAYRLHSSLNRHMRIHYNQQFTCEICDEGFSNTTDLIDHVRVHTHGPTHISPYVCTKCGKSFSMLSLLNHHVDTFHDESQPSTESYKCGACSKRFISKEKLINHKRLLHKHIEREVDVKSEQSLLQELSVNSKEQSHENRVTFKKYKPFIIHMKLDDDEKIVEDENNDYV